MRSALLALVAIVTACGEPAPSAPPPPDDLAVAVAAIRDGAAADAREEAWMTVVISGPPAVAALVAVATDRNAPPQGRVRALEVLTALRPRVAIPLDAVAPILSEEHRPLQRAAASAIEGSGSEGDACLIEALAPSRPHGAHAAAAEVLGRTRKDAALVPALARVIDDDGEPDDCRSEAVDALERIHLPQSIPPLLRALDGRSFGAASRASWALAQIGAPAIPGLLARLGPDTAKSVRFQAIHAFLAMGPAGKPAAPALVEILRDPNAPLREWAASALGRIDPDPAVAVPALVAATREPSARLREWSVDALGDMGPAAAAAEPDLVAATHDSDADVAAAARKALDAIRTTRIDRVADVPEDTDLADLRGARRTASSLLLSDPDAFVAAGPGAMRTFIDALFADEVSEDERGTSLEALGRLGLRARPAVRHLRFWLAWGPPTPRTAEAIRAALAAIGGG